MKEIRYCEKCKDFFKEEDTEQVSLKSHYEPRYSSIEGHTVYDKTIDLCKKCLEIIKGRN